MERSQSCTNHVQLLLLYGVPIVLLVTSTILHRVNPASLSELLVSFVGINALPIVGRLALEDILLSRRALSAAGVLNGLFGAEACFTIIAAAKSESVLAQNAMIGIQLSYCFMVLGNCIGCGTLHRLETMFVLKRLLSQLAIVSFIGIAIPAAFGVPSSGEFMAKLQRAATFLLSVQSILLQPGRWSDSPRKEFEPCFSLCASIPPLLLSSGTMMLLSMYIIEASEVPRAGTDWAHSLLVVAFAAIVIVLVEQVPAHPRYRKSTNMCLSSLAVCFNPPWHLSILPLVTLSRFIPGIKSYVSLHGFLVTTICITTIVVNCVLLERRSHWIHALVVTSIFLFLAAAA